MEKPFQIRPVIVKKGNIAFLKKVHNEKSPLKIHSIYKDEVIYDTKDVCFLKGDYQRLLLLNRRNLVTKCIITVAKYFSANGTVLEKTSERIASLIGQEEYKTVFSGLCSILDQNLKIRSILALLTTGNKNIELKSQNIVDKCCQTDEMRIKVAPLKKRRRIRIKQGPYIVNDFKPPEPKKVKRVIVHLPDQTNKSDDLETFIKTVKIENLSPKLENLETEDSESHRFKENSNTDEINEKSLETFKSSAVEKSSESHRKSLESHGKSIESHGKSPESHGKGSESDDSSHNSILPVIDFHEELSNDSEGGYSSFSIETSVELMENPMAILVDRFTKDVVEDYFVQPSHVITVMDGNKPVTISLPYKPEDDLHIATPENLQLLNEYSRKLLIKHQMMLDLRHCLTVVDDDGNLPIHLAVLNDDVELIRRQCIVLKIKNRSVDIPAHGLTPLMMSLYQDAPTTSILLQFGADVMQIDNEHRTPVHLAAERNTDHLPVLLKHCWDNARKILLESDLWKPEMETKSDAELSKFLLHHICTAADKQGYTPLIVSSKLGRYENVRQLLEQAPDIINYQMPTSGNTALYLACDAACNASTESGDKTKVDDHFQKTLELLIKHGADPAIDNYSGSNVNTLLTEFNCLSLSFLIASQVTKCNIKKNSLIISTRENCDKVMLVKSETGSIDVKTLENEKLKKSRKKPVNILQNIQLKKPSEPIKSTKVNESTKISNPISKSAGKIGIDKKIILTPESVKNLKRKMAAPVKQIKILKK